MALTADISPEALAAAMPGRPLRTYPAVMSTDADAVAWARAGVEAGAIVTADYQAAPRGRGGLPWTCRQGIDLSFSLILRPDLSPDDEGWLYVAAGLAVLDVLGDAASVEWPDRIHRDGRHVADVAAHAGLGPDGVEWAIVNVLVPDPGTPRAPLIARLAAAIEALQRPDPAALERYRERCSTLGTELVALLIPMWPDGVRIAGTAATVLADGALVIQEPPPEGRRMAVRPQHLARLEPPPAEPGWPGSDGP